jgi:hypothetical protein
LTLPCIVQAGLPICLHTRVGPLSVSFDAVGEDLFAIGEDKQQQLQASPGLIHDIRRLAFANICSPFVQTTALYLAAGRKYCIYVTSPRGRKRIDYYSTIPPFAFALRIIPTSGHYSAFHAAVLLTSYNVLNSIFPGG